jgi:D-cysteine desulfhydrase/L-cysteate sulfo-lyase
LASVPTPLEEAPRLASELGLPCLFVKRDDLTGLAFGGNKSRNYEFRLAEVLEKGLDTVIAYLDLLSNSQRQLAAAGAQLGLEVFLVLCGEEPPEPSGNLLISRLLGAQAIFVPKEGDQRGAAEELRCHLASEGRRPVVLNDSPMFAVASALAYVLATLEVFEQLEAHGVDPASAHLYMSSTGKGQAGLELATRVLGMGTRVTGIAAEARGGLAKAAVARVANDAARLLGLDLVVGAEEVDNREQYVGPGYGRPSEAGNDAFFLAARYACRRSSNPAVQRRCVQVIQHPDVQVIPQF